MDPNATLKIIMDTLRDAKDSPLILEGENRMDIVKALRNLADWIDKGGFLPDPI